MKRVTSAKYRYKTYMPSKEAIEYVANINNQVTKDSKTYWHYNRILDTLKEKNSSKFILKLLSVNKSLRYLYREVSKREKQTFKQLQVNYYPTPKNINEILPIIRNKPIDLFSIKWLIDLQYELKNESFISLVDFENS